MQKKNITEPNGTEPSYLEPKSGRLTVVGGSMRSQLSAATHMSSCEDWGPGIRGRPYPHKIGKFDKMSVVKNKTSVGFSG